MSDRRYLSEESMAALAVLAADKQAALTASSDTPNEVIDTPALATA